MRMLLNVKFPNKEFNAAVKDGTADEKLGKILDEIGPEAIYFTKQNGQRAALLIVDLEGPWEVPAMAEPWFLAFNADVSFHIIMTPDDLKKAGLAKLGKKWS